MVVKRSCTGWEKEAALDKNNNTPEAKITH